jgi:O-antigen/teichoic acid export membrane protein
VAERIQSTGSRIARNTLSLFASEGVGRLLSFFANLLLARHFDLDPFGQYALAVNLVGLAASFGDMGLNALTIREVAADKTQAMRYLRASLFWRFASSLVMLGGLALWGVWSAYEPLLQMTVLAMGTRLIFDALSGGYVYLLQAHERMTLQGWVVAIGSLARFLGMGAVVLWGGGIISAAWVWSIVSAMTLVFLVAEGKRSGWTPSWADLNFKDASGILRLALPLAVMGSLQMMYYRVDVVMIKHLAGNGPVALYHNAYRLLEACLVFANMAALASLPALSARRGDAQAFGLLAEKLFRVLVVGGAFIATVGAACSGALMPLLFGSTYAPGGETLRWLFWTAAPFFINALVVNVWTVRSPKRLVVWYLGLLAVNVGLNFWWIPRVGSVGAAYATLTCEWFGVLFALPWVLKEMPVGVAGRTVRLALGTLVAVGVVTWLSSLWPGLQWALLGPLGFAALLLFAPGLSWGECQSMLRGWRGS